MSLNKALAIVTVIGTTISLVLLLGMSIVMAVAAWDASLDVGGWRWMWLSRSMGLLLPTAIVTTAAFSVLQIREQNEWLRKLKE